MKLRGLAFALVVSVPTFAFVSVADASTPGAACKKAGLTKGSVSNQLICKKVGKNLKWVQTGRAPGALSIPLTAYSLGRNSANQPVGIQLNWYYPMDFGSSLVSGYRFEVQSASTPWLFVSNLSASTYSANVKDDNLAGKSLRFRIAAFNSVGVGVFSETNWIEYPALSSSGVSVATVPSAVNSGISTTTTVASTTTSTTTSTTLPAGTVSQRNAVSSAASYLKYSSFSRSGLISQLQYEGFSLSDATYGTDAQNANWNTQAVKTGASYLRSSSFSRSGLISQLQFEGFSGSEATYGTDSQNADWNAQAARTAASYLKSSSFSRSGLISQLLFEGFTQAQAEYGVGTTGL